MSDADGRPRIRLVIRTVASRQVVVQACPDGRRAGIRPGLTVAQARTLVPQTQVRCVEDRPDLDRQVRQALARWLLRITPRVADDEPDGLMLDLTGCDRLHCDEVALMRRVRRDLARLGFGVRLAVADTVGAAWAAVRYLTADAVGTAAPTGGGGAPAALTGESGVWRLAPGRHRDVLASLPVAALRLEPAAIDELAQVGIETIGQLSRVPRRELAGRGGGWRAGGLLARFDQAMGRRPEAIEPILSPVRPSVERVFDGPVVQPEAIVLTARALLGELVARLESLECGVRRLDLRFDCPDVAPQRFELSLGVPTRSLHHLWSMLAPRLERVHLDFGVEAMWMQATRVARLHQRQGGWNLGVGVGATTGIGGGIGGGGGASRARAADDAGPDAATRRRQTAALGELVDTLADRLGPDRVVRRRPVETHVPEQGVESRPAGEPEAAPLFASPPTQASPAMVDASPGWAPIVAESGEGGTSAPAPASAADHDPPDARTPPLIAPDHRRPSRLLDPPEPVEVLAGPPDAAPRRLRWRGRDHLLVRSIGPERLAAPWWEARRLAGGTRGADPDAGLIVRDYYRVQDERGRWLWLFRRDPGPAVQSIQAVPATAAAESAGASASVVASASRPAAAAGWFVHGLWA